jgi:hypothetical protein
VQDHAASGSPGVVPTTSQSTFLLNNQSSLVPRLRMDHIPGAEINSTNSLVPAVPKNPYATTSRPISQPFFREPAHLGTTEQGRKHSIQRMSSRSLDPLGLPNSGSTTKSSKKAAKSKKLANERPKVNQAGTPEEDEKDTVTVTVLLFPLPVGSELVFHSTTPELTYIFPG